MDNGPFTWLREAQLAAADAVARHFPGTAVQRSPWRVVLSGRVTDWLVDVHLTANRPGVLTLSARFPAALHTVTPIRITSVAPRAGNRPIDDPAPTWQRWATEALAEARSSRVTVDSTGIHVHHLEIAHDETVDPIWLHARIAAWGRFANGLESRIRTDEEQAQRQVRRDPVRA